MMGPKQEAQAAQHDIEPRLQILQVLADGGPPDVQLQFGRRHAAGLDDRTKDPEQAHVDVANLSQ